MSSSLVCLVEIFLSRTEGQKSKDSIFQLLHDVPLVGSKQSRHSENKRVKMTVEELGSSQHESQELHTNRFGDRSTTSTVLY